MIDNKLRLSVIIPIYRVEAYLPTCLDSICASIERVPAGSVEVICIDDGSPDDSGRIADAYAEQHAYVNVIHQQNTGVAAARNRGIESAQGEWLYFVDSDDWLPEDSMELIFSAVTAQAEADVILMDARQFTGQNVRQDIETETLSNVLHNKSTSDWQKSVKEKSVDLSKIAMQSEKKDVGVRSTPWEHFPEERIWTTTDEMLDLQRRVLYFPAVHADTKCPMAAPWDKVYKREFLNRCGIRFSPELRVLDDMFFNMQVMGAASRVAYCKHKIYHYRYVPDSITNSYQEKRVEYDRAVWQAIERYADQKTGRVRMDIDHANATSAAIKPQSQSELIEKYDAENDGKMFGNRWSDAQRALFTDAFYCRIIKSFSIACRLSFFNAKNHKRMREKFCDVRAVLESEPYKAAFRDVNPNHLEWKLKWMRFMGRHGFVRGIYLLHLAQTMVSRKR